MTPNEVRSHLQHMFETSSTARDCWYASVRHSYGCDLEILYSGLEYEPTSSQSVVGVLDTNTILAQHALTARFGGLWQTLRHSIGQSSSLAHLHNVGNDAVYTSQCLLAMAMTPEYAWRAPPPMVRLPLAPKTPRGRWRVSALAVQSRSATRTPSRRPQQSSGLKHAVSKEWFEFLTALLRAAKRWLNPW